MPMTVQQALKKLARFNGASGTCWNDPGNLERLNEARELLYERGDWAGTTDWAIVSSDCGQFCLPIQLETARAVYACRKNVDLGSYGHLISSLESAQACCGPHPCRLTVNRVPWKRPYCWKPTASFGLHVSADDKRDTGAQVRLDVRGIDGQERAITVAAIAEGRKEVDGLFADLLSASKPLTFGYVKIWAKFKNDDCVLLVDIPPDLEFPALNSYELVGSCCENDVAQLAVLAKRRFMPATDYGAILDIQSITALRFVYQALNAQDANDDQGYVNKLQLAENALDKVTQNLEENEPSVQMFMGHTLAAKPCAGCCR